MLELAIIWRGPKSGRPFVVHSSRLAGDVQKVLGIFKSRVEAADDDDPTLAELRQLEVDKLNRLLSIVAKEFDLNGDARAHRTR